MTGPTPTTVTPERNMLAELWHRFSNTQIPLGSAGAGGVDVNDVLWPITDNRGSDRMLPETFSVNDLLGAISKAPQSADVGKMATDQVEAQHTAPDPNEPYGAIKHLIKLLPMSLTFGGGAVAPAVERGTTTVGTYAGVKSATADVKALAKAKDLEMVGGNAGPAGEIRQQTGWFKDEAGDWKYEISDHESAIKLTEPNAKQVYTGPYDPDDPPRWLSQMKVTDALEHDDLLAAYPWLKDVDLFKDSRMGHAEAAQFEGGYSNPPSEWAIRTGGDPTKRGFHHRTLMHEVQHAIQEYENHARGGNPRMYQSKVDNDLVQRLLNDANDYSGAEFLRRYQGDTQLYEQIHGWPPSPEAVRLSKLPREETEGMSAHLLRQVEKHKQENDPYGQYMRTLGEVEARDTEARLNLDPDERRRSTPYASQGIAKDKFIIARAIDDLPQNVPLDMSPEARAARAALQGYNLDAYHGTTSDFSAFETQRSLQRPNPDAFIHVGDQEAANGALWGHHGRRYWEDEAANAPDPKRREEAQREIDYHYRDTSILPLKVKANNPLDMPDLGRWDSHSNFMSYAAKEKGWGQDYEPKGWNPSPEVWGDFRALVDRVRKLDWEGQKSAWQEGFTEILTKHGYDSVRYPNEIEGSGGHSYLLLDPSQARSRFAEFHPDKVGDPNLLSGRAGVPVTPNTPPPGTDPEREARDAANRAWLTMGGG